MTYRNATRYPRRAPQLTGPRPNRYDGGCFRCGRLVPAGTGILTGNADQGYEVRHGDRTWTGVPCGGEMTGQPGMGRWTGGCEDATDQPVFEARPARPRRSGKYGWTSTGARVTERFSRCEDAPCCGCCD